MNLCRPRRSRAMPLPSARRSRQTYVRINDAKTRSQQDENQPVDRKTNQTERIIPALAAPSRDTPDEPLDVVASVPHALSAPICHGPREVPITALTQKGLKRNRESAWLLRRNLRSRLPGRRSTIVLPGRARSFRGCFGQRGSARSRRAYTSGTAPAPTVRGAPGRWSQP